MNLCFWRGHQWEVRLGERYTDRRGRWRKREHCECVRCGVSLYAAVYQQLTIYDHIYCWKERFRQWRDRPSKDDELPF